MVEFAFACLLGALIWGGILGFVASRIREDRAIVLFSGLVVPWIAYAIAVANGLGKGDGALQGAMAFIYLFTAIITLWIGRGSQPVAQHEEPQRMDSLLPMR